MANRERLRVWLAVDLAILTVRQDLLNVLVIERNNEPYQGQTALPGGFIRDGEDLQETAVRELAEETGPGRQRLASRAGRRLWRTGP
jgi:8-oxo-dGTP diphosphatase